MFETKIFLFTNSITGDLGGLGVSSPVEVSTLAHDFAQIALVLMIFASITGILGAIAGGQRQRRLTVFTGLLFIASVVVFAAGLSSTLSEQGRGIFSSQTLSGQGSSSTVTSGLALGFYVTLLAAFFTMTSYVTLRRREASRALQPTHS